MSRVVLAMSGGVDSSVAAHLLLEQSHDVIGVFMRHGKESLEACGVDVAGTAGTSLPVDPTQPEHKQGCCSAVDAEDARRVADGLGIPFYALNLQAEFAEIVDYFTDEYSAGRTPNPCVMCNQWIKFGRLFDYADSIGAEFVATGHYARILPGVGPGVPALCRGLDATKDQSYALFGVDRDYLRRMLLPVGHFQKLQIREMATQLDLRVADKRDSQEICFVASGKHAEFVRLRRGQPDRSGEIVTTDGRVVGPHGGIEAFTVGQRRGLGVALGEPFFVVRIDAATRTVVVGRREELVRSQLAADRTNWLVELPPGELRCRAQIRYNSRAAPATATLLADRRLHLAFDQPQFGVAPGQAVVCYDGPQVLGGGWIT